MLKKCFGDTQLALNQHIMKREICIHLTVRMIDYLFLFLKNWTGSGINKNHPICTMLFFFYIHKFTVDFNCTKQ